MTESEAKKIAAMTLELQEVTNKVLEVVKAELDLARSEPDRKTVKCKESAILAALLFASNMIVRGLPDVLIQGAEFKCRAMLDTADGIRNPAAIHVNSMEELESKLREMLSGQKVPPSDQVPAPNMPADPTKVH